MEAHGAQPSSVDSVVSLLDVAVETILSVRAQLTQRIPTRARRDALYRQLQGVAADVQKVALALK